MSADLELAMRDLVAGITQAQARTATGAAASAVSSAAASAQSDLLAHAAARFGIHGVGAGFFVAKTANPAGFVRWVEIVGRPTWIEQQIDPETLELDASQITTGTLAIARLPTAASGETSASKVVLADDMRLSVRMMTAVVAVPIYAGFFVTMTNDGRCQPASNTSPDTAAIGYVTDSFAVGQTAQIFTYGENQNIYVPLITSGQVLHPVYLGSTPGHATMDMPTAGIEQQVGVITSLVTSTVARGMITIQPATPFV